MSNERGPLREVSWRDVFNWLIIFRTFRISIGIQVLFLASLGATATTVGWVLSDALFVREAVMQKSSRCRFVLPMGSSE